MSYTFGRLPAPNRDHETEYPYRGLKLAAPSKNIEIIYSLTKMQHNVYNQTIYPACVGAALSEGMTIFNRGILYDFMWLYREAQKIDGIDGPHDGTTTLAGMTILTTLGHKKIHDKKPHKPDGLREIRWGATIDDVRTAFAQKHLVVAGVPWRENLFNATKKNREWWLNDYSGDILGGHEILISGRSDKRGAVQSPMTWGEDFVWPVWIPDKVFMQMIDDGGEIGIMVDDPKVT